LKLRDLDETLRLDLARRCLEQTCSSTRRKDKKEQAWEKGLTEGLVGGAVAVSAVSVQRIYGTKEPCEVGSPDSARYLVYLSGQGKRLTREANLLALRVAF